MNCIDHRISNTFVIYIIVFFLQLNNKNPVLLVHQTIKQVLQIDLDLYHLLNNKHQIHQHQLQVNQLLHLVHVFVLYIHLLSVQLALHLVVKLLHHTLFVKLKKILQPKKLVYVLMMYFYQLMENQ
jgi:hypothetical protein